MAALPPSTTKSTSTGNQPDNEEKDNGADGGVDDQADRSAPEMDAQARQQPVTDERADYPDYYVSDQTKAGPPHELPGQPSGNKADDQYDNEALIRQMHGNPPWER
jgi:hypothetical protein